jgi:hypothetical protein
MGRMRPSEPSQRLNFRDKAQVWDVGRQEVGGAPSLLAGYL